MKRRIIVSLCCLLMLVASPFAARQSQAQGNGLRLLADLSLPDSTYSKYPHVAVGRGQVQIAGNANRRDAQYWTKADTSVAAIGAPLTLGPAEGKEDYSNTSVTVAADGAVYYAWSNQTNRNVYLRRLDPNTKTWGPRRLVNGGSSFPVSVEVGVSSKNEIFVIWRDPDEVGKYRRSQDLGASWIGAISFTDNLKPYGLPLGLASGPNGLMAASFTAFDSGYLQAFVSLWDPVNEQFDIQRVSNLGTNYGNTDVTVSSTGVVYVAWRGVEVSGSKSGYFYAERQTSGEWARSQLVRGDVIGTVNIATDEQDNLSFVWNSRISKTNQVYFAFAPAKSGPVGPITSSATGQIFNPNSDVALTTSKDVLTHVVYETFNGGNLKARYMLFQSTGAGYGVDPKIEGDAATVGGKSSVQVTFQNPRALTAANTQVRWRWGAAPTDTANDSGGWTTYASTITVPIPASILSDTSCQPSTLYTQVRDTVTNAVEQPANKDSITVDGVVEAAVSLRNPFTDNATTASTAALSPSLAATTGAVGAGDPNYTRVPAAYLRVVNLDDCTGLSSAAVGKDANSLEITYKGDTNGYSATVPLPDLVNLQTGARPVTVQVRDVVNNVANSDLSIIYDNVKPVFNVAGSGPTPLAASANPSGNLFQDLTFTNINATDDLYRTGTRQFWGVWVANSRTPVADPLTDANLVWSPIQAPGTGTSFTLKDWSLGSGIAKANVTAGAYYIYVRVLDGAGNPSDGVTSITLNFASAPTAPAMYLPLVRR